MKMEDKTWQEMSGHHMTHSRPIKKMVKIKKLWFSNYGMCTTSVT